LRFISAISGADSDTRCSREPAAGDMDGDGREDLVNVERTEPVAITLYLKNKRSFCVSGGWRGQ
jgi:hypothetical protein